jgi:hypothetical protein
MCNPLIGSLAHKSESHYDRWSVSQLIYDRQSVCQPALVSGAQVGPVTNFSFSLKDSSQSFKIYFLRILGADTIENTLRPRSLV